MKILLVHYRYFISGGPERYLFNVKKSLESKGHIVIPFSIKNTKNENNDYSDYFVRNIGDSDEVFVDKYPKTFKTYIDLVAREFYSLEVKYKLEKLIIKEKPDICYLLVYKRALSPSVIDACYKHNVKIVNRISDYNMVCGNGSLYCKGKFCEKCLTNDFFVVSNKCVKNSFIFSCMRYASIKFHNLIKINDKIDKFICTNEYMAIMMKNKGFPAEKLSVIPTFFKENDNLAYIKKTNEIVDKTVKFLFIGNIDETKGAYDLLEAVCILKEEVNNFHITFVGGLREIENTKLLNYIEQNKLSRYITFVPFVNSGDIYNYYLENNVTILPSRWVENLPNTLIESLYFNRPVVVPNYGSFKYTVNGAVSFKYKALSFTALYRCLKEICENPHLIEKKALACESYFNSIYSEEEHINSLLKLFEDVRRHKR